MYNDIYLKEQFAYERNTLFKWLGNAVEGKDPVQFFENNKFRKVVIYGVRGFGELFYKQIKNSHLDIVCFADRDYQSYPLGIDSIEVCSVPSLTSKEYDVIVVTPTFYFKDIANVLLSEGVSLEKIVSLNMIISA